MENEKTEMMRNKKGFIAALDQSGGSSGKTLELYGISRNSYTTEEEMFNLIHEMRKRVIKSKSFTSDKIIGVILFEKTMNSKIDDMYTADYLWSKKMLSFLKIDKGLEEELDGVRLMKDNPSLESVLHLARERNIYGTKMRSVIKSANKVGIRNIVKQQFDWAKIIINNGLVPIIEPEVDINSSEKEECEKLLKEEIFKQMESLDNSARIMFKFTIPSIDNFYSDLMNDERVVRVVALSGGYTSSDACERLSRNKGMIASFSRALLEGLNVNDTEDEFDLKLGKKIDMIYDASIK